MASRNHDPRSVLELAKLAKLVQARLPRELRDNIYAHLWDVKVLKKLYYTYQMVATVPCAYTTEDRHGNTMCTCDLPNAIPQFARAVVVGARFAHEAVVWLYDNYEAFQILKPDTIPKFFQADVFHLGLTPLYTRIRRLKIEICLDNVKFKGVWATVFRNLVPLFTMPFRNGFRLEVSIVAISSGGIPDCYYIYETAMFMKSMEPFLAILEYIQAVSPWLRYNDQGAGHIDVEYMLRGLGNDKWHMYIQTELEGWDRNMILQRSESYFLISKASFLVEKSMYSLRRCCGALTFGEIQRRYG